jgi:FBP C-terminal treble-clef zinc-finger
MLRIGTEEEMKEAFRPIDQDEVQFPSDMLFPLLVRDYLSWVEPSGHRAYLVFADPAKGAPRGIVFKRNHTSADAPPAMCDWCHSVRGKGAVGLLTATVSPNRRIGLTLCRDLNCKEKIDSIPGVNDLRESVSHEEKKQQIVERMSNFARRNLF